MMKFTTKLFLAWMSVFLLFYIAVIIIIGLFWGIRIHLWQLFLGSVTFSVSLVYCFISLITNLFLFFNFT
jgi:hypothetical protein